MTLCILKCQAQFLAHRKHLLNVNYFIRMVIVFLTDTSKPNFIFFECQILNLWQQKKPHMGYPLKQSKCILLLFFFFWPLHVELLPPGMEPMPSAEEIQSPNHWTIREVPRIYFADKPRLFLSHFHLQNSLTDLHGEMSMSE